MTINNNSLIHYDIINNIIIDESLREKCTEIIRTSENSQEETQTPTGLARFSRHISLEHYYNVPLSNNDNSHNNIEILLSELSTVSSVDDSMEDDSVLLLQLSSTLDKLLNQLSIPDRKVYLYRYFFAYSVDHIANLCGTQPHNVEKTLVQCNNKFKDLIKKDNLTTNSKSLLLSFTDIDDSHLILLTDTETNEKLNNRPTNTVTKKSKISFKFCLNVFFGLALLSLIIANLIQYTKYNKLITASSSESTSASEAYDIESFFIYEDGNKVANIDRLMGYAYYSDDDYHSLEYDLDGYYIEYQGYQLPAEIPLSLFTGTEISDIPSENGRYYKLLGTESYQYIIFISENSSLLYVPIFRYLMYEDDIEQAISYTDTLCNYYGINNPTDIKEIQVTPADVNTGYADSYTAKIIDHETDIANIYNTLINCPYKGTTVETILSQGITSYSYLYDHSVRLNIYGKNQSKIDTLLYYPEGNFFFDYTNYLVYEVDYTLSDTYPNLNELLRFNIHEEEPSDPESWLYTIRLVEADPMYLSLNVQCGPNATNKGKYIGSDFYVKKLENNKWIDLPYNDAYDNTSFFLYDQKLDPTSSASPVEIYFIDRYTLLQPGIYRLTLTIYDINNGDINNPVGKEYVVDFQIN